MKNVTVKLPTAREEISSFRTGANNITLLRDNATQLIQTVYQPLGQSKFLKGKITTKDTAFILILGNLAIAEYLGIENGMDGGNIILKKQAIAPHIIKSMKLQTTDETSFNYNPVLHYFNADGQVKTVEIDLSDYLNEYQYKNKILTIPIRFVFDYRFMFLSWQVSDAVADITATVTLEVEKVLGKVNNI